MGIYVIKNGCLICGSDIKGNKERKYFCKKCNVLFSEEDLKNRKKQEIVETKPEPKEPSFFVASVKSGKFHRTDCPFLLRIKDENKLEIKTQKEAIKLGYKPCVCLKVKS